MRVDGRIDADMVVAAQAGDERAIDDLVARYLPLVYNIVGRALSGHADVDDVVQETMLRVVHGLDGLRDPARFRSWLVAIAVRQVNDRWRARQAAPTLLGALGPGAEPADPGSDFVDLTIMQLGLAGERREVAEATAWLDPEDGRLLSLWWLEAAGELNRAELASALQISQPHAAVRVQRMKTQLDVARTVVRALARSPRCPELTDTVAGWHGRPGGLWRKRIARHVRRCETCAPGHVRLVPAEALLAAIGLVPPPATSAAAAHGAFTAAASGAGHGTGWLAHGLRLTAGKPMALAAAAVVAVSGTAIVYAVYPSPRPPSRVAIPAPSVSATTTVSASSSPSVLASSASPPMSPSSNASSQDATSLSLYGSEVDGVDVAPAASQQPGTLPQRPAATPVTATGKYEATAGDSTKYIMNYNGDYLTLRGQGYFRIRWQIIYTTGRIGQIGMPTWTGLTGKLFHVASGGGRRMNDQEPGAATGQTWMGSAATGFDSLPAGTQQMWQNEYFYLDGTVVLHQNQGWPEVNLIVEQMTWQQVDTDVNTKPDPAQGIVRYGLVRDTGDDRAPVPQYLTRSTPTNPTDVAQHSVVN